MDDFNTYQLKINELTISVTQKNIKNLRLIVHPPNGQVCISAPLFVDSEMIKHFVLSKFDWIKKQQAKIHLRSFPANQEFVSGEKHYFQGKVYTLDIISHAKSPKIEVKNDSNLILYVKPTSQISQRISLVRSWYRKYLNDVIPNYIKHWEPILNVQVQQWGIKLMKTRWGSCNIRAKRIWLNLELAKKDPLCLEYVIVHEMIHLLEPNHGPRFIALMDQFLPNWKTLKDKLNSY
jgi:hypothetical protein